MAPKLKISTVFDAVDKLTGPVKTMQAKIGRFSASASRAIKPLDTAANGIIKGLAAVGTAAIAAAGTAGKFITDFATRGDEIAKTARMLGMSSDALQELRYAAGMQGVETEALNNAFKLMNNNLGQLRTGQGALYTRLKLTNPALARQLRTVEDSDEAFMMLMDAIDKETNSARRAALAQAAFGRAGQELIKFAEAGADGIAELRAEAHTFGQVIDKDAAEASEAFSDSLARLKGVGTSLFNDVLGQAVVKLQPIIQSMAEWVAANKELIGQHIDQAIGKITSVIGVLVGAWKSGLIPALLAGVAIIKVASTTLAVFNAIAAANPVGLVVVAVGSLVAGFALLASQVGGIGPAFKVLGQTVMKFLLTPFNAVIDVVTNLLDLLGKIPGIGGTFRGLSDTLSQAQGSINKALTGSEGAYDFLDPFRNARDAAAIKDDVPMSPNAGVIESRSVSEYRSTVDVNFTNPPAGTSIRQRGVAPGVSLNLGAAVAGGAH